MEFLQGYGVAVDVSAAVEYDAAWMSKVIKDYCRVDILSL